MDTKRPLSARRPIRTNNPELDSSLRTFLRTPVKLENLKNNNYDDRDLERRRPQTARPKSRFYTCREDNISNRRRAFEISHERKVKAALKQNEREWDEEERYRKWKTAKVAQKREAPKKDADKHVLETIVQSRNEYYLSGIRDSRITQRTNVSALRTLPPEVRTVSRTSNRVFYWGD